MSGTITNTIVDITGAPLVGITVNITFVPSQNTASFDSTGVEYIASKVTTTTNSSGIWTATLKSNTDFASGDTYYKVDEIISSSKVNTYLIVVPTGGLTTMLVSTLAVPVPAGVNMTNVTPGPQGIIGPQGPIGTISLTGSAAERMDYGLRAGLLVTGGGNLSFTAGNVFGWSARFIVISGGNSTSSSTSGYFDIVQPTSGAVAVQGGSITRNWSSAGVQLNGWEALWYTLPIGSGNATVPGNFFITSFIGGLTPPSSDAILIAVLNGDAGDNTLRVCTGFTMVNSSILSQGKFSSQETTIPFHISGAITAGLKIPKFIAPFNMQLVNSYARLDAGSGVIYQLYINGASNAGLPASAAVSGTVVTAYTTVNISAGDIVQIFISNIGTTASDLSVTVGAVYH